MSKLFVRRTPPFINTKEHEIISHILKKYFSTFVEENLTIKSLIDDAYNIAKKNGMNKSNNLTATDYISSMHIDVNEILKWCISGKSLSEVSFDKNNEPYGLPIDLADLVLKIGEFCGKYNIDLESAIETRLEFLKKSIDNA